MDNEVTDILPAQPFSFGLREVWRKRELLYFFVWRDVKVKYRQTYLGILWAILQPLLMMGLFYLIFSRALQVPTGNLPYIVYTYGGLVLWGLFSSGITNGSESMTGNANIIRKIYFPRLIIPISGILAALIDFSLGFIIFLILLLSYHVSISWIAIWCIPAAILMTILSSFGIGSLLAALNVKYRDFRYLLPFVLQLLFFSSQIVYSLHSFKGGWFKYLLYCHPLNGALEIFMHPLQKGVFDTTGVLISIGSMLCFLFTGLLYFKKTEYYFADLV